MSAMDGPCKGAPIQLHSSPCSLFYILMPIDAEPLEARGQRRRLYLQDFRRAVGAEQPAVALLQRGDDVVGVALAKFVLGVDMHRRD